MSDNEHPAIPRLKRQLADGRLSRRGFLRYSTLLGMSAGAAYMWAGKITGQPFAPPVRAAEMPKGGTLKVAMRIPKIDDPHTYSWIYDANILRQVCGYLTRTGHDNVTRPHLCESWEASDDLRTWTLKMREVNWHDGRPFTAEDAAWNFRHVLDPETGSSVLGLMKGYMLNEVDTGKKDEDGNPVMSSELWDANAIEVVDDRTLRLNLKEPQVAVPEHLFHYPFGIVDPEEGGKFGVGSNGTEAFELVEFGVGEKAVLKARKEPYYGEGPYLDEIQFIDLGDNPAAVAAAISSQQVHGMYEGNVEQLPLFEEMDHVTIYDVVTADTGVARMQVDREQFKDPRVRKAVRLAIDQDECLKIAHRGLGAPAEHHHVSPIHPDYAKLGFIGRDVEKAKALLAEAGHPDGIDLEIACKPDPSWELTAVETMVSQWKEAGIRVKINVLPSSKYWEVWTKVPFGFTSWVHRPLGFMALSLAYRSGVPWNETNYANEEFDALLTKAEGILDIDERREVLAELEEIMQEDGPIAQPLWRSLYVAYDNKVKGFQMHPTRYIFGESIAMES
ncbi:ABC transporter substrate-binding protein [Kaustia mangrovi]|uniref:ABC transporter substrate-binding protein n=1 Tax=Kaustia mangrovi TaxID=2593653 RepID=A0A7S8C6T0_9HYPH|nr:ABC transporter substrate-binding protein [Kaustia mangrovi]QPC44441.1 ABC transporter substrate-binding protein [Kaustia mangrovi]